MERVKANNETPRRNSNSMKNNILSTFAVIGALTVTCLGQPSSMNSISFQGALNGPNGQPLPNGSYNFTFKFYDLPAGGAVLGIVTVPNVPVSSGLASTAIPVDPAWFTGQTRYLGVSPEGGTELTPRIQITAVPYALNTASFNGSVSSSQLTGTISPTNIADGSIAGYKLVSGSVTAPQLASNSVTSAAIVAGAVSTVQIATGAVTAAKIAMSIDWRRPLPPLSITNPLPARAGGFAVAMAAVGTDKVAICTYRRCSLPFQR